MPIPPFLGDMPILGAILGILLFAGALALADQIALFLVRRSWSRRMSTDRRKMLGIVAMFVAFGGGLVAGMNDSAWLAAFVGLGMVAFLYVSHAGEV